MEAATQNSRHCPRCRQTLTVVRYEAVEIDQCGSCQGAYLDANELSKILKARGVAVGRHRGGERPGVPVPERARSVDCPGCGSFMSPVNFNYSSGTILDRCGSCAGVWCDGQELEKAQAHYETHQDGIQERKPALIALVTDVENQLASRLQVFARWKRRRILIGLLWAIGAGWAAWEAVSPTTHQTALRIAGVLIPTFVLGLWISRCPACAKPPAHSQWRRPWTVFTLSECEPCGVPLR